MIAYHKICEGRYIMHQQWSSFPEPSNKVAWGQISPAPCQLQPEKMSLQCKRFIPCGAETGIFQENHVPIMVTDALSPCVTSPSWSCLSCATLEVENDKNWNIALLLFINSTRNVNLLDDVSFFTKLYTIIFARQLTRRSYCGYEYKAFLLNKIN